MTYESFQFPDNGDYGGDEKLYAGSVEEFVEHFIKPHYIERLCARWCDSWADHRQTRLIFEGLWRSFEEARGSDMGNAGGQSTMSFYLNHFIPAMDTVARADGVFKNCKPGHCAGHRSYGTAPSTTLETDEPKALNVNSRITALSQRVVGQDDVISQVAKHLTMIASGVRLNPARPAGLLMFTGPSGCGKTELAHAIAEIEFGSRDALIRLDLAEYSHQSDASRLTGSAPGYLGSDQPEGWLTTKIIKQPKCVLLLDEMEKAHYTVYDTLLGAFDAGRLTDGRGQTADFSNVIVIMTSNLGGKEYVRKTAGFGGNARDEENVAQRVSASVNDHFRPEFLGRLDGVLQFQPLSFDTLVTITEMGLKRAQQLLADEGWDVEFDEELVTRIAEASAGSLYGARDIHRLIEELAVTPTVCEPKNKRPKPINPEAPGSNTRPEQDNPHGNPEKVTG